MLRRRFPAMGTQIELVLDAPPGGRAMRALARAEEEFHRLERLLSRFDPESELSRLNERGTMSVGPELLEVASLAVDARRRTGGRFDPTVHDALVAAGYDRTFDRVPARADRVPGRIAVACGGGIAVDRAGSAIELEPGVRLDLGGIGKGYAADRAAALLAEAGPCLVDAGGDVALLGRPWPVGVETPDGTLTLELASGGLATSGRDRRRWTRGGREQHHLIDPATGRPAVSDVLRVTVAAPSAADAEVLAKALFFAGAAAALREANAEALPAVIVTADGRTLRSEAIG
jgi:thiamine biosynthesis lipoprotein